MKITGMNVYQQDLPLKEGRYSWSNGNFVEVFDSTVLEVITDEGLSGYAECCPLGSAYSPSFAFLGSWRGWPNWPRFRSGKTH